MGTGAKGVAYSSGAPGSVWDTPVVVLDESVGEVGSCEETVCETACCRGPVVVEKESEYRCCNGTVVTVLIDLEHLLSSWETFDHFYASHTKGDMVVSLVCRSLTAGMCNVMFHG